MIRVGRELTGGVAAGTLSVTPPKRPAP